MRPRRVEEEVRGASAGQNRPLRPLVWLAGTLAGGSALGIEGGSGGGEWCAIVAAGLVVALALRVTGRFRAWPLWIVPIGVLAFLRGFTLPAPPPPGTGGEEGSLPPIEAREGILVGRWRAEGAPGGGRGWLEPPSGGDGAPAAGLLFTIEPPAPPEGAWIAILPGERPPPWPRSREAGPAAREGRFFARVPLLPDEWVLLDPLAGDGDRSAIDLLRERLRRRLAAAEGEGPLQGLLQALVLGERRNLAYEDRDLFTRTGTRHLLAVSGLHVSLVAALLILPLTRFLADRLSRRRPRRIRLLAVGIALPLLTTYALLAGGGAPVVRATVAVSLGLLAPLLASSPPPRGGKREESHAPHLPIGAPRRPDSLSLWALALTCECLVSPGAVTSLPVRLSYLATLGLLLATGGIRARLPFAGGAARGRGEEGLRRPVSLALRLPLRWLCTSLLAAVAASGAAILATLPEVWRVFGEFSPLGAIVTPAAVPLLVPLLVGGWTVALGPGWLSTGVEPFAIALRGLLEFADTFPGTPLPLPPRPALLLWGASGCTLAAAMRPPGIARRGATRHAGRLAALLWGIILLPWSAAPRQFELHVLDVGHGTCSVVRAPGLPALVFDAGSLDRHRVAGEALLPLLARWEAAEVVIGVSHAHADHTSGLARLVERYPPHLWLGAVPAHLGERLPHGIGRIDPACGRVEVLRAGGGALAIDLIRGLELSGDEGSRSLELVYEGERVLLMGDAVTDGLEAALRDDLLPRGVRLLLLPHHGTDSPLFSALLERCRPREVWASNAELPPVAGEVARRGIPGAWTGGDGPLALFLPSREER